MNFAIIGCGIIGRKRSQALQARGHRISVVADPLGERAEQLASACRARSTADWQRAISDPEVQAVVVATTNCWLAPITMQAIQAGKHVLVEKPAARSVAEIEGVLAAASQWGGVCVQVGFNHRYHPSLQKAREIVQSGALGPLLFVRGRYGHGGRVGYDREWRSDPEISGGGELIDQGVHLIDLARWFLGEFTRAEGHAKTYFWNMPVDDNAFLSLRTANEQTAWLHVSCTEWKNLFSLEIYGRDGKLDLQGLGGSYGVERIAFYRMLPQMGPPETTIWEFPGEDQSWQRELADFERSVDTGINRGPTLSDARSALQIVESIYSGSGMRWREKT